MTTLIYGVGLKDVPYKVNKRVNGVNTICPFYMKWKSMLQRAYSPKFAEHNRTYMGATVVKEWLSLSNFKVWMEGQIWEGNQLDKDLLIDGNKEYGPDSCVFIPRYVNVIFTDARFARGELPLGVTYHKRDENYQMKCGLGGGERVTLDGFKNPLDAHMAWAEVKRSTVIKAIDRYREEEGYDVRVDSSLQGKVAKLSLALSTKSELIKL